MIDEKDRLKTKLSELEHQKEWIEEQLKFLEENTDKYFAVPIVFFARSRESAQALLDTLDKKAWASLQEIGEEIEVPPDSYGKPAFERAARSIMIRLAAKFPIQQWNASHCMKNDRDFEDLVAALDGISNGFRELYSKPFSDELQELLDEMLSHFSKLSEKANEAID